MKSKLTALLAAICVTACAQTSHETVESELGSPSDWGSVERTLAEPGPIDLEVVIAANWKVPRSGVINLKNEEAEHLEEGDESIQIYMYALRHPEHGLFLIDTGVDRATSERDFAEMAAGPIVRGAMNLEDLEVLVDTQTWLESQPDPVAGVFMTHMHLDHAMGLPDIPDDVPIYTGPGEVGDRSVKNVATRSVTNRTLEGKGALQELRPMPAKGAPFEGVLDVFGDGSLTAIHIPGHTAGSLAFLVKTTGGPVLLTGDGCHTAWGWDHRVEPGTFNADLDGARDSLLVLRDFADAHPEIAVHLGHQPHERNADQATVSR